MEGLGPKLDLEDLKHKMCKDILSSIHSFHVYIAVLCITPFVLKKLDSI
uniref:Mitochondrial import receptor subunit TOM5 homolog n=1 Tax=Naja naja TaxID=35670 RepID=A0A8C6Y5E4_NAJNA